MAVRSGEFVPGERLVLTQKMPTSEVADRIVVFFGELDAAWIAEGIRARLSRDEFDHVEPRSRLG